MTGAALRVLEPIFLVALGTFAVHRTMPATLPAERDEVFLPKPQVAKVAALGFESVLSDYYWIQAMYKVGGSHETWPGLQLVHRKDHRCRHDPGSLDGAPLPLRRHLAHRQRREREEGQPAARARHRA